MFFVGIHNLHITTFNTLYEFERNYKVFTNRIEMAFNTLYEFEGIEDYYIHEIKLSTLSMSSRNISHLVTSTGSSFNTLYEFPDNHACSRRYNGDSLSTLSMSSRYGRYRCIRFDILSTLSMSS